MFTRQKRYYLKKLYYQSFMAWFEVDIFKKCVEVDLHGYTHMTAIWVMNEKIKEAYEHGFKHVKLIHGAAYIMKLECCGSIKFALREKLRKGELGRWIEEKGSKNHEVNDGYIILALRKNPVPVDSGWKEIPADEY